MLNLREIQNYPNSNIQSQNKLVKAIPICLIKIMKFCFLVLEYTKIHKNFDRYWNLGRKYKFKKFSYQLWSVFFLKLLSFW